MRRALSVLGIVCGLSLLSQGCQPTGSIGTETETKGGIEIVTTILPMTQFAAAVAGNRATVSQLIPPTLDPHSYQATPQDVRRIAEADLLVQNGLGVDNFVTDLIENADNASLTVIDTSATLPTEAVVVNSSALSTNSVGVDRHDPAENTHGHEDGHGHDHGGAAAGDTDPHVWLDPKKAIVQVEAIRDALIEIDPDGREDYSQNANEFMLSLQQLDQEIAASLAPLEGQTFVTYHNFAGHFAKGYGLNVVYLVDIPESSPTPTDVQRVIETVQAADLRTLLTECSNTQAAFRSIADDLQIQVAVFDPIETTAVATPTGDDYLTTMAMNAEQLTLAFCEDAAC